MYLMYVLGSPAAAHQFQNDIPLAMKWVEQRIMPEVYAGARPTFAVCTPNHVHRCRQARSR